MNFNTGDTVSHVEQGAGSVIKNFGDGEVLIRFSDGEYTKFVTDITLVQAAPAAVKSPRKPRGWTSERRQFYFEQYNWLKEVGPQSQPFGVKGKMRQAEYREKNGLSFVDPVLSNLSLWGGILADKGYVYQQADGQWAVTEKAWEE
jgi:hypothetical protein